MPFNSELRMSKRINASSRITFFYKTVIIPITLLIIIAFPIFATWLIRGPFALFFFLLSGLGLVFWWHMKKIKMVSFDDKFLYVRDSKTEKTFNLTDVKKIKYVASSTTFTIEMTNDDDIFFLPKTHVGLTFGYWPDDIIELENRVKSFKGTVPNMMDAQLRKRLAWALLVSC